jgi:hypothetical protein
MLLRTAKSCGPDAPTLASSSRSCVGPTGLRQNISADDGGKRARSPGRARHKPLKPLRAGMPGDSGVLVVTRVRSTTTKCTRDRGCSGHPAFPTPSKGAEDFMHDSGASRRGVAKSYLELEQRHCERSEAIHSFFMWRDGLLRGACHRARRRRDLVAEYDGSCEERSQNHPVMPAPRRHSCRPQGLPASCQQIRTLSGAAKSDQGRGRAP